jgi:hypothetical protein
MIVVIYEDFQLQEIILIINTMDKNIYVLGLTEAIFHTVVFQADTYLAGECQCL